MSVYYFMQLVFLKDYASEMLLVIHRLVLYGSEMLLQSDLGLLLYMTWLWSCPTGVLSQKYLSDTCAQKG